jgi:uncharacterized protein YciI
MNKTMAVFMRHGLQWNSDLPVRMQAYWDEHAEFIDALFDRGTIVMAGPFADDSGSMLIVEAESIDLVRETFRGDPWVQKSVLVLDDVKEWTIFVDARRKTQNRADGA